MPGVDSNDSEAPPTIRTVALPVYGFFGGVDNKYLILLTLEAQLPISVREFTIIIKLGRKDKVIIKSTSYIDLKPIDLKFTYERTFISLETFAHICKLSL